MHVHSMPLQNTDGHLTVVQVALLFRSHDDLLQEFTYFLPDNSVPQVKHTFDMQHA